MEKVLGLHVPNLVFKEKNIRGNITGTFCLNEVIGAWKGKTPTVFKALGP